MKYSLTQNQKDLARLLVKEVRAGNLSESFRVESPEYTPFLAGLFTDSAVVLGGVLRVDGKTVTLGTFNALAQAQLLIQELTQQSRTCTLTGLIYHAVDSDFADDEVKAPISTLAQPHPTEIAMSLDRLR